MKKLKLHPYVIAAIVLAAVVFLGVKIITGAIHLVTGIFNLLLGIAVIVGTLLVIAWMFAYAKKNKK